MVHATHSAHAASVGGATVGDQLLEHLVGGGAGAIDPVVEDEDPLGVVTAGVAGVVDDHRGVQPAVELDPDVGVKEVGARIRSGELVHELAAGLDRILGEAGDAVGGVGQSDAVPVNRGVCGELVVERESQEVTRGRSHQRAGKRTVVGPRRHRPPAQVKADRPGRQRLLEYLLSR